jgi:lysophospholipase L1-like esterase
VADRDDRRGGDDAGAALTIVALGDSTTAVDDWSGQHVAVYPDLLAEALATCGVRARVVNAGICGTTTRGARERLDRDVRAHAPDLVVIQFGINDSWIDLDEGRREPRLTRREFRDDLRALVRALTGDGARVVLMTPNPMRWADPYYIDAFAKAGGLLDTGSERGLDALLDLYAEDARTVARDDAVPLVDVHRAFEEYGGAPGQAVDDLLLERDGIHPSAAGQRLVCRLLAAEIAALVLR